MALYGLIGYPLGHSFSKKYFTEKFAREGIAEARYELFPLENIARFPDLLAQHPDLRGLNVTLPHKQTVIPFLDTLDDAAREVGAVNCIAVREGRTRGFNTDVFGFEHSLRRFLKTRPTQIVRRALVLGNGGGARAVFFILKKMGIPFVVASRRPSGEGQVGYGQLRELPMADFQLIVNTTPLGMAPASDGCPDLPFEQMDERHFVFDLVYNPTETVLLRRAKASGAATQNGLEMLHFQAEKAWEIWQANGL